MSKNPRCEKMGEHPEKEKQQTVIKSPTVCQTLKSRGLNWRTLRARLPGQKENGLQFPKKMIILDFKFTINSNEIITSYIYT